MLMAVLWLCNATSNRLHLEAQNERGGVSTQNWFVALLSLPALCQLNVTFLICYMVQTLVLLIYFIPDWIQDERSSLRLSTHTN